MFSLSVDSMHLKEAYWLSFVFCSVATALFAMCEMYVMHINIIGKKLVSKPNTNCKNQSLVP